MASAWRYDNGNSAKIILALLKSRIPRGFLRLYHSSLRGSKATEAISSNRRHCEGARRPKQSLGILEFLIEISQSSWGMT